MAERVNKIPPGVPFDLYQGDDFYTVISIYEGDSLMDLTGATFEMPIRTVKTNVVVDVWTTEIGVIGAGQVSITIDKTVINAYPIKTELVYDFKSIISGFTRTLFSGPMIVKKDVKPT